MLHSCNYQQIWEGTILEACTDTYSTIKVYFIGAMQLLLYITSSSVFIDIPLKGQRKFMAKTKDILR
jgi:hypothetical protein